jgi:NADH:ubiquinone oxidoreductase subunit 3 (subunit A)
MFKKLTEVIMEVSYVTVILLPIRLQPIFSCSSTPVILSYMGIYVYLILGFVIALALVCISSLFSSKQLNLNKTSPYECGFERFNNSKLSLNTDFFVIGILFLMFDLELALLFP